MSEKLITILCQLVSQPTPSTELRAALSDFTLEDWQNFKDLAENHSLLPLVYARLKSLGFSNQIPESYQENMHRATVINAARNTVFLHEAKIILQALTKANILVIGLKGVYLLENIYPDISTRTMNDLDLMLKKADIPAALTICQSLGYQPTTFFDINDENLDIKHVPPLKKERGPYLELHWTILEEDEPFTIDADGLWERAIPANITGVDAFALSPEDLILHLSLHLSYQHHFNIGLRGLVDIAAVLRHFEGQVDWQKLIEISQAWGATRVLWLTLTIANDLLGAKVPPDVLSQIQPAHFDPWVVEESRAQLLSRGQTPQAMTPDLAEFAKKRGFFQRTQLIWRRIFLPKRTLARLYNIPPTSPRIYGCYFKRMWELFQGYRISVKHILSGDPSTLDSAETQTANQRLRSWISEK